MMVHAQVRGWPEASGLGRLRHKAAAMSRAMSVHVTDVPVTGLAPAGLVRGTRPSRQREQQQEGEARPADEVDHQIVQRRVRALRYP